MPEIREDARKRATRIVKRIIADLNGRGGLGFNDVDVKTQKEIREAWIEIVFSEEA